jgi:hypothetical protein
VPLQELARLTALQWRWEETAREFRGMYRPLREHAVRSEHRWRRAEEERDLLASSGTRRYGASTAPAAESASLLSRLARQVRALPSR